MSTWQAEPSRNVMLIDLELWELSERDGTSSDRKSRSAVKTMKAYRRSIDGERIFGKVSWRGIRKQELSEQAALLHPYDGVFS